jgi:transglutaminase-like putative cysteine protease
MAVGMRIISAMFLAVAAAQGPPAAQIPNLPAITAAARVHYNAGRSAEALALLQPVIVRAGDPAPAALVAARALLERYRASTDPADLSAAREHLAAIDPAALRSDERRELIVGLAEALYLEDAFAASAELFETALGPAGSPASLSGEERERALDWWATALDRHAQLKPQAERRLIYGRIADRMERETRDSASSTPAAYWLAAAARGAGELDRAWAAAVAAWVRASMMSDRGAALRADIDRLAQQALIPERARALGLGAKETEQAMAGMQAEWELMKTRWSR